MTADPDGYTTDCAACGHPQDGHGTRYAAGAGDHEHIPEVWAGRTTETGDETSSRIYRHEDRGLAMWPDPSRPAPGGGDRLPTRTNRRK
jgi:hypothetical protein